MKVTHTVTTTVLEGTPEELARMEEWPKVAANLTVERSANETSDATAPHEDAARADRAALPSELDDFIARRSVNNPGRSLVRELAEHFIDGSEATWKIGSSSNSPDGKTPYFSLYAPGPQRVGAAAYVFPVNGRVIVRLMWNDGGIADDLRAQVFRASEKEGGAYAVGVMVTTRKEFDVAVQLIRLAIQRAREA